MFNTKLVILGFLIAFFLFFCNLLYLFFSYLFGIRVIKFSMFFSPRFSLYDKKIGNTDFVLGWVPIGSSLEIFGKTADIEERRAIPEHDLPFAFFTKKLYQQIIIVFTPTIMYFSVGVVCAFLLLKSQNELWSLDYILTYLKELFNAMFGSDKDVLALKLLSKKYASENNIVLFSYFLFSCFLLFCAVFDNFMNYLRLEASESKIKNALTISLMFFPAVLGLWKVPSLIFKYYTFGEVFSYLIDFVLGILVFGSAVLFITIFILKLFKPKFLKV
ncbi:hypothetical protein [Flavobacterium mesophilum]|uniref:hypothetical protein n=1 Tax=Flavobacterium mesophilum TaxID=3143495 RepID=UPI0031DAB6D0